MNNTVGLEGLVVGPYRWAASTYSSFIRDVYNVIKPEMERLHNIEMDEKRKIAEVANGGKKSKGVRKSISEAINNQEYDTEIAQFVQQIISKSNIVLGNENWVDILSNEYWDILKLDEYGKDRYKFDNKNDETAALKRKSVVHLLKLIRDKIEHIRTYKDEMKEKLNTFFDKDEKFQYQFNENKFVTFFISTFPKLVPYLWLEFYKFRGIQSLSQYYPDYEIQTERFRSIFMDMTKFDEELKNALLCDVENGNLLKRFKVSRCSLEFRGSHNLVKCLDKNLFIKFIVSSEDNIFLSVSHSSTNKKALKYDGRLPRTEKSVVFFVDNITDSVVWENCNKFDCRVIVFCDPDKLNDKNIKVALEKFIRVNNLNESALNECPVLGSELSEGKQKWVFENCQVCIQGRDVKIKDIFSDSSAMAEALSGNLLNKLLKNEKVTLFPDYEYPKYNGVYIERKLVFRNEKLTEDKLNHIYFAEVCSNKSGQRPPGFRVIHVFKNVDQLRKNNCVESNCEVISFEDHKEFSNDIFEKCEAVLYPRIIRYFQIIKETDRESYSRLVSFPNSYDKEYRQLLRENEFLKIIRYNKIKSIYFLAESGMGKSQLLVHFRKLLENSLVMFSPFRHFVDILQEKVRDGICSKTDIIFAILETLKCKDECEKLLLEKWLQLEYIKVDLQLDGLDEVPSENFGLALKAMKIIQSEFISIRLWVTSTKPFTNERNALEFIDCSIAPFLIDDKCKFFELSWEGQLTGFDKQMVLDQIPNMFERHKNKAQSQRLKDLTDYPLCCGLLASFYEDKLAELISQTDIIVGVDLYESQIKRQFAVMHKQQYGISLNDKNGDAEFRLLRENYFQVHTHFALIHLFPNFISKFKKPSSMRYLTEINYCKMGIITSIAPITFTHLTYADFFVAWYIVKVLETGELDNLCSKETFDTFLCFGKPDESSSFVRFSIWIFVDEYLGKLKNWNSLSWLKTHKNDPYRVIRKKKHQLFLTAAIKYGVWNLARLLHNLWWNDSKLDVNSEVLQLASVKNSQEDWFNSMYHKLSSENQYRLIIHCVKNGRYDLADQLVFNSLDFYGVFEKIAKMSEGEGGIFHCIANRIANGAVIKVKPNNFVEETKMFIKELSKYCKETKRRNKDGNTFWEALSKIKGTSKSAMSRYYAAQLESFLSKNLVKIGK